MLNEVFKTVAKRQKVTPEQVELVYKSWINGIRYFITHPFISKGTIRLFKIGSFKITHRSAKTVEGAEEYTKQFKRNERRKKNNSTSNDEYVENK